MKTDRAPEITMGIASLKTDCNIKIGHIPSIITDQRMGTRIEMRDTLESVRIGLEKQNNLIKFGI